MMHLLRKYQRVLFLIISIMTIASFLFFGTFTGGSAEVALPDKEVAKAVDGSSIMQREVQAMTRFLSLGTTDVVEKDLLGTGLASILVEHDFENVGVEFQARLDQLKRYKPYVHPQAPFLSASAIWERFNPQMNEHLATLKTCTASPSSFSLYSNLYLTQAAFPPSMLKHVLNYQQQQYGWIVPDQQMTEQRLAILGYQTLDQWFGERFMNLVSEFFVNAAIIAEEKGYRISTEEAKADLLQLSLKTLKGYTQKQEASSQEAQDFLQQQLHLCGLDEITAIKLWKKILLFRRLFEDVGHSVLLDPLLYEQFAQYSGEKASIDLYQLPELLRFKDFRALLKFQLYLDAIAPKNRGNLKGLSHYFLSAEELEKKVPELVQSRFELEVARVSQEDLNQKVTLKETWKFEASDKGWELLVQQFPQLKRKPAQSSEERFHILEATDAALRVKMDHFARMQLITLHPEWIEEKLQMLTPEKVNVALRSHGATAPFVDIEEPSALLHALYHGVEGETLPVFASAQGSYYRIKLIKKADKKQIMTFKEALQANVLDELLDRQLEEGYETVRRKDPQLFQEANGRWKPYREVKDQVGAKLYADLLKAIAPESLELPHYCGRRFAAFMREAKKSIQNQGENSIFMVKTGDPLKDQFLLTRRTMDVKRSDALTLSKEELFKNEVGSWSSISTPSNGDVAFFHLIERASSSQEVVAEKVEEGQKILGVDAKRLLLHQILKRMEPSTKL